MRDKTRLSDQIAFSVILIAAISWISSTNAWAANEQPTSPPSQNQSGSYAAVPPIPGTALARPVTAADKANVPPAEQVEQVELYKRSDENITLQTVYIQNTLGTVKDKMDYIQSKQGGDTSVTLESEDTAAVEKVSAGFCTNIADSGVALSCLQTLQDIRVGQLRELRVSLQSNHDSIARLQNELTDANGMSLTGAAKKNPRAPVIATNGKSVNLPKILPFLDLSLTYDNEKAQPVDNVAVHKEIAAFVQKVFEKPKPEDYIKTQDVKLSTNVADKGTYSITLKRPDGRPVLDDPAYQKALVQYDLMVKSHTQSTNGTQKSMDAVVKEMTDSLIKSHDDPANIKARQNLQTAVRSQVDAKIAKKCDDLGAGPRRDYCQARFTVVRYFNGEDPSQQAAPAAPAGQPGSQTMSQGPGRTIAGAPASQTKPAANAVATEDYLLKGIPDGKGSFVPESDLYMDSSYIDGVISSQDR